MGVRRLFLRSFTWPSYEAACIIPPLFMLRQHNHYILYLPFVNQARYNLLYFFLFQHTGNLQTKAINWLGVGVGMGTSKMARDISDSKTNASKVGCFVD